MQKREDEASPPGPLIKIRVSHGSLRYEVDVPELSTFGELKRALVRDTGVEQQEQRLIFRGRERKDEEYLHLVGVKDKSKMILLKNSASVERKDEEMKRDPVISRACVAVSVVREEVNQLSERVSALESQVYKGAEVADNEFVVLTELLMRQLLKLDGIVAEGEAKLQRKIEVRRVQTMVDTLDSLKMRNKL